MKIIFTMLLIIILVFILIFIYSAMKVSSEITREEEYLDELNRHKMTKSEAELIQQRDELKKQIAIINNQLAEIGIQKIKKIEHKTQETLDKGGHNV